MRDVVDGVELLVRRDVALQVKILPRFRASLTFRPFQIEDRRLHIEGQGGVNHAGTLAGSQAGTLGCSQASMLRVTRAPRPDLAFLAGARFAQFCLQVLREIPGDRHGSCGIAFANLRVPVIPRFIPLFEPEVQVSPEDLRYVS